MAEIAEKEIARVKSVHIGVENHGILTLDVVLDFGGSGQVFGGHALDAWDPSRNRRIGTAAGTDLILCLLELFGVGDLQKLTGRVVYALREHRNGPVVGLEIPPFDGGRRFLIADWHSEWFGPEAHHGN